MGTQPQPKKALSVCVDMQTIRRSTLNTYASLFPFETHTFLPRFYNLYFTILIVFVAYFSHEAMNN